ncbi:MAG TPA: hypothetical protein VJ575_02090 [Pseudogulbenkiania sp.]|nr:hypothetical protein [Pseudogulbenkiania sp.]
MAITPSALRFRPSHLVPELGAGPFRSAVWLEMIEYLLGQKDYPATGKLLSAFFATGEKDQGLSRAMRAGTGQPAQMTWVPAGSA